jgi:hypothetical protein
MELPWSLGDSFLASGPQGPPAENPAAGIRIGLKKRPLAKGGTDGESGSAAGEGTIDGALLGEFIRRYARALGEEQGNPKEEQNYLAFRLLGTFFIIPELPLALGFLALGLIFFCGLLFLPSVPPGGLSQGLRQIPAAAVLWLCAIVLTGTAFYRLSLYPFYAPALIPAFAARSVRRPLFRRICMGAALLCLGMTALFLRGR